MLRFIVFCAGLIRQRIWKPHKRFVSALFKGFYVCYNYPALVSVNMEPERAVSHIEAIGRFLEAAKSASSADVLDHARTQQFSNVKRILMECCLEGFDTTRLVQQLVDMGFSADQHSELMQELQYAISRQSPTTAQVRVKLQDYTSLAFYFKKNVWEFLLAATEPPSSKMHTIVFQACLLGLRNPSEATFQHMTAIYMLCADGLNNSLTKTPLARHETLMTMKTAFRQRAASAKKIYVIPELPKDPELFRVSHRSLYEEVFPEGGPVGAMVFMDDLAIMQRNIPMRAPRSSSSSQAFGLNGNNMMFAGPGMNFMQQLQAMGQLALNAASNNAVRVNLLPPATAFKPAAVAAPVLPLLDAKPTEGTSGKPLVHLNVDEQKDSIGEKSVPVSSPEHLPVTAPGHKHSVADATAVIQAAMHQKATDAKQNKDGDNTAIKPAAKKKAAKAAAKKKVVKPKAVKEVPKSVAKAVGKKKVTKPLVKKQIGKGVVNSKGANPPVKKHANKGATAKSKAQKALPTYSKSAALKLRPSGCSKCRQTPGCTPSCVIRFFKYP